MNESSHKQNEKSYTREQYRKIFFPSSEQTELLDSGAPFSVGTKLASDAVNRLKLALKKHKDEIRKNTS